jgi:hypothetical protein
MASNSNSNTNNKRKRSDSEQERRTYVKASRTGASSSSSSSSVRRRRATAKLSISKNAGFLRQLEQELVDRAEVLQGGGWNLACSWRQILNVPKFPLSPDVGDVKAWLKEYEKRGPDHSLCVMALNNLAWAIVDPKHAGVNAKHYQSNVCLLGLQLYWLNRMSVLDSDSGAQLGMRLRAALVHPEEHWLFLFMERFLQYKRVYVVDFLRGICSQPDCVPYAEAVAFGLLKNEYADFHYSTVESVLFLVADDIVARADSNNRYPERPKHRVLEIFHRLGFADVGSILQAKRDFHSKSYSPRRQRTLQRLFYDDWVPGGELNIVSSEVATGSLRGICVEQILASMSEQHTKVLPPFVRTTQLAEYQ